MRSIEKHAFHRRMHLENRSQKFAEPTPNEGTHMHAAGALKHPEFTHPIS